MYMTMDKFTGSNIKKEFLSLKVKERNLINKINKKFDLILDQYREYLSDSHKQLLIVKSMEDFNIERKLAIIIQTEANYVTATGNQIEMFN